MDDPYKPYVPKKEQSLFEKAKEALSHVPLIGSNSENNVRYTEIDKNQEEDGGLMGKIWSRTTTIGESVSEKFEDAKETAQNYQCAILLLVIGSMVIFVSTFW